MLTPTVSAHIWRRSKTFMAQRRFPIRNGQRESPQSGRSYIAEGDYGTRGFVLSMHSITRPSTRQRQTHTHFP